MTADPDAALREVLLRIFDMSIDRPAIRDVARAALAATASPGLVFPDADTERAVRLGASWPGSIEDDIARMPADKAFAATGTCGCKADSELGGSGVCPACGHRDHGRSGCRAALVADRETPDEG